MLSQFTAFSLVSSLFVAAGMIVYKLFLAQQCQHRLNRMVLGGIMAVSIVALPALLSLPEESHFTPVAEVGLPMAVGFTTDGVVAASTPHIDIMSIVEMLIVAGAALMLLRLLVATGRIMALIQRGESIRYDDFTLVLIDRPEIAPFSFFKKVVVSRADYERHGEMIATHELAHICSRHWFDLLSAEILLCVQWYNPAAWLMLAQLREVHEYEADEKVVTSGFDKKKYQYLLLEKAAGVCFQSCANSLNHSKLKNRIAMMYKSKSSPGRRMRALVIVPAVAAAFAVTQIPAVASALRSMTATETPAPVEAASPAVSIAETPVVSSQETKASTPVVAKPDSKVSKKSDKKQTVAACEKMPQFPGGDVALMNYVRDNLKYPEEAKKAGVQGRVVVRFVVKANGSVASPEIIRSVSPDLDTEALRIVGEMPRWTPGSVDGKPVDVQFTLPVFFRLKGDDADKTPKTAKKSVTTVSVTGNSMDGVEVYVNGERYHGSLSDISSGSVESMDIKNTETTKRIDITIRK